MRPIERRICSPRLLKHMDPSELGLARAISIYAEEKAARLRVVDGLRLRRLNEDAIKKIADFAGLPERAVPVPLR